MVGNLDREATIEETASMENEPGTLEDDNKVTQSSSDSGYCMSKKS